MLYFYRIIYIAKIVFILIISVILYRTRLSTVVIVLLKTYITKVLNFIRVACLCRSEYIVKYFASNILLIYFTQV
jgi:hypothetical protein